MITRDFARENGLIILMREESVVRLIPVAIFTARPGVGINRDEADSVRAG
jgi:hypothetical protein